MAPRPAQLRARGLAAAGLMVLSLSVGTVGSDLVDTEGLRFGRTSGRVGLVHDGGHDGEYQVVDAPTETTVFGFQVPSAPDQLSLVASEIAALVSRRISG
ncbi:MAG: hypothetical protein KIT14_00755 [bacterium]|nr:hypothetical protein [bacterium]